MRSSWETQKWILRHNGFIRKCFCIQDVAGEKHLHLPMKIYDSKYWQGNYIQKVWTPPCTSNKDICRQEKSDFSRCFSGANKTEWKHYCDRLGFEVTPHQFRHAYATMLYDAGIDVKMAQKLLGHSSEKNDNFDKELQ